MKFWDNPFKWYINQVKESIIPQNPTHTIDMNIGIQKGEQEGTAPVPCAIYTLSHSIDLNPSLIRKKDKKVVKHLPVGKKIEFDSRKYDIQLTKEEKEGGYELRELERCKHCGNKIVIAKVAETRYRSCPDIKVKIADKAKEDLNIPVNFGIRKPEIILKFIFTIILNLAGIYWLLVNLFGVSPFSIPHLIPSPFNLIGYLLMGVAALFIIHIFIVMNYSSFKLWNWYKQVKPTLKKVKNYKKR